MASGIIAAFKRCEDISKRLNEVSDLLSVQFDLMNSRIAELGLGVSAWLEYTNSKDGWNRAIGYTKNGKKAGWGLALRRAKTNTDGVREEEVWPINGAPRWFRVESVAYLAALIELLANRSVETTLQTERATEKVKSLLSELGEGEGHA